MATVFKIENLGIGYGDKMIVEKVFKRNHSLIVRHGSKRFEAQNPDFSLGVILEEGDEVEIVENRMGIPSVRKVASVVKFQQKLESNNHSPKQAAS